MNAPQHNLRHEYASGRLELASGVKYDNPMVAAQTLRSWADARNQVLAMTGGEIPTNDVREHFARAYATYLEGRSLDVR